MRQILIYCFVAFGLISCGFNKKKISQAEFEQLLLHDSIANIMVNNNRQAEITIKPFHRNDKTYILPIESAESFDVYIKKWRKTLNSRNIHSTFQCSINYGTETTYLLFIYPIFILCTLILFLFAITDVLRHRFEPAIDKLIWLFVLFIPVIGPLLYIFIGRKQKLAKS